MRNSVHTRFGRLLRRAGVGVLSVLTLVSAVRGSDGPTSQPATSQPDPARFAGEIRAFVESDGRSAPPRDAILFVGSSSIRRWATSESFPQWPALNRGFGGSQISDVNHYFAQTVAPYDARVVVFYAGDNDIAAGVTPARVRDDFAEFLRLVRARGPETPVVFLSIKPSPKRWDRWPRMQEANALIRALTEKDRHLVYADVATPMLGQDGRPLPELYVEDKLHLSQAGYDLWTRILTPIVERIRK